MAGDELHTGTMKVEVEGIEVEVASKYEGLLLLEPRDKYDPCLVGVVRGAGMDSRACYSYEKVMEAILQDGHSLEDAQEHFSYNVIGAYVGLNTPCFLF